MSFHILSPLSITDPKYVKLSTPSKLKSPIIRFWRYLLACVEDIFMYLVFSSSSKTLFNLMFMGRAGKSKQNVDK
jgi:hypothetical protein